MDGNRVIMYSTAPNFTAPETTTEVSLVDEITSLLDTWQTDPFVRTQERLDQVTVAGADEREFLFENLSVQSLRTLVTLIDRVRTEHRRRADALDELMEWLAERARTFAAYELLVKPEGATREKDAGR